jgi:flagella basal body P-ring formation protein FlgA
MRMLRLSIASIVLMLLTTSAVGCQYLSEDEQLTIPTRDVVVAAQAIEQGASIEREMLAMRSVPIDDTNSMALEDPALALGKVAVVDIPPSQMITPNLLVDR